MGHRGFTTKRYLWISRPLWATYVGTPEQNPSSILISELIKARNWVVENFDGISPGLVFSEYTRFGDRSEQQRGRQRSIKRPGET